jgi:YVTN family beta-propeller protein
MSCTTERYGRLGRLFRGCVRLLPLTGFLLLGAVPSFAFLIQTFESRRGKVQFVWNNAAGGIPFVIDVAGSQDVPDQTVYQIIRASFQAWEDVPTARLRFIDQGLSSSLTPNPNDRRNLVIFDTDGTWLDVPAGSGVIATTLVQGNRLTGQITDADIVFNDRDFLFSSRANPPRGSVNLQDVATHEIGHFLGLDHSPLNAAVAVRPTMSPFYGGDGPGQAISLEADDKAGVSELYPVVGLAAQTGRFSGQVENLEGQALFGVHVMAEDVDSDAIYGTFSGAYPNATGVGHYSLRGLPPGRYRIAIEPISSPYSEDNFGGIFENLAIGFSREYYDNVASAGQAVVFEVGAGEGVNGIDFISGFIGPGPTLSLLGEPVNTPDTQGPYLVEVEAQNALGVVLQYRVDGGLTIEVGMVARLGGGYTAAIPAQSAGSRVEYQVVARGEGGEDTVYPSVGRWAGFEVVKLSGAPMAYIALRQEDAVSVIDTGTEREVSRIPVGDEPIQIVLDAAGERLYVSNLGSNEISVIETATFRRLAQIRVEAQPLDMALAADGRTLYVSNSGAASLSAIDVQSFQVRTLPLAGLASGPFGIATGVGRIYVADFSNNEVLVLDESGTVLAHIGTPEGPRSLAISLDGSELYISSFGSNSLAVIGLQQNAVIRTLSLPVSATFAVAVGSKGEVYLTAHDDGVVVKVGVDPADSPTLVPVGANPRGVSLSPSGDRLFVTSAEDDEITVIDPFKGTVLGTYSTGGSPRGIVLDLPAGVLVADAADGSPQDPSIDEPPQEAENPNGTEPENVGTSPEDPPADGSGGAAEEPSVVTDVGTGEGLLPEAFALEPNYPNPFNVSTQIVYRIPTNAADVTRAEVAIYSVLGHKVRVLAEGVHGPGVYTLEWDGRNASGIDLASGVYLVGLRTPAFVQMRKMVLVR